MSNIAYRILRGYFRRFGLAAVTILQIPRGKASFPDDDPMRNSHELGIGKLDARAGVAIVQQYVDAGGIELLVQRIGRLLDERRLLVIDRHQDDLERRNRLRPENAVDIVILLDGRGNDPRDANSVTAHEHRQRLTLLVQHAGIHGGAVQLSELENMADFDPACDFQGASAGGTGVAALRIADIDGLRVLKVAPPVHAAEVHVFFVGPADEIRQVSRSMLDIDLAAEPAGSAEAA